MAAPLAQGLDAQAGVFNRAEEAQTVGALHQQQPLRTLPRQQGKMGFVMPRRRQPARRHVALSPHRKRQPGQGQFNAQRQLLPWGSGLAFFPGAFKPWQELGESLFQQRRGHAFRSGDGQMPVRAEGEARAPGA